jgi:RNA polymerase sigma-70 factor (sigma-E family)
MSTGESFSSFFHAYSPSLYRTAYLLTADGAAAEELLQDVLVRIYPRWSEIASMAVPAAYVRRAVVNGFVSSRRRSSFRDTRLGSGHDVGDGRDLAQETVDRDLVWKLVSSLPPRQRAALVLRFYEDCPDAEIAAALGCRVATVRSLVSRGLRALREGGVEHASAAAGTPCDSPRRTST